MILCPGRKSNSISPKYLFKKLFWHQMKLRLQMVSPLILCGVLKQYLGFKQQEIHCALCVFCEAAAGRTSTQRRRRRKRRASTVQTRRTTAPPPARSTWTSWTDRWSPPTPSQTVTHSSHSKDCEGRNRFRVFENETAPDDGTKKFGFQSDQWLRVIIIIIISSSSSSTLQYQ